MSINNSQDSLPLTQENASMQNSPEPLNAFMSAPVRKLHADEYIASDLDGVTDSSTGSGNLNFLMMQAGQTDAAISTHNPYSSTGTGSDAISALSATARGQGNAGKAFANTYQGGNDSDNSLGSNNGFTPSELTQSTRNAGESSAINNTSSTSNYSTETIPSPAPTPTSSTPSSSQNGTNGTNGANGADGTNGNGGGNVTNITNITNNNTTNNYTENTTNNETNVSVVEGDITNITEDVADILTTITNNVFETINNVINEGNLPLPSGPIGLTLDATLDQLTNLNLDLINGGNVLNALNETIDLSPILDPLSGITGNLLSDTSLGVILDPFNYDSSADDHDLAVGTNLDVLGIGIPDIALDIPLDAVEFLLGDVDINLDLANDLLGPDILQNAPGDTDVLLGGGAPLEVLAPVSAVTSSVVNVVENVAGDIDLAGNIGLGLLGTNDTGGTDTDLTIPLDLDLLETDLLNENISINLDLVEQIIGDVDIDLSLATNLLGQTADGLIDGFAGGSDTANPLSDLRDGVSDLVSDILPLQESDDTDVGIDLAAGALDSGLITAPTDLVLDPVEDLVGDIDVQSSIGLGILGTSDTTGADTDLVIPLNLDIAGFDLVTQTLSVPLDPLEAIIGDIDLDLGIASNILGNTADNLFDSSNGGTGNDGLLAEAGSLLGSGASELLSDIPHVDTLFCTVDSLIGGLFDTAETAVGIALSAPAHTGGLDLGALLPNIGEGLDNSPLAWTESIIPDATGLLGGNLLGIIDTPAVDPIAVAAPVISLITPVIPVAGGILGGGGHHGGLFG